MLREVWACLIYPSVDTVSLVALVEHLLEIGVL